MMKLMRLFRRYGSPNPDQHAASLAGAFATLAAIVLGLALTGCQTDEYSGEAGRPAPANPMTTLYSTNRLHEGDVVDVTFQYATNFNTLQRIALDGSLNMNTVGAVKAAGKTVIELQQELATRYKDLAKDDVITVNRVMNSTAIVYVSGAVLKPGEVELDRPLTALEAVMAAGGFDNSRAKMSEVKVIRLENGRERSYAVNLRRVLEGNPSSPFYLKPFDIIYVPVKVFNY